MISGQNALENLLSEINKKANPAGTVFLFSRTETADNISEYLRQNEILFPIMNYNTLITIRLGNLFIIFLNLDIMKLKPVSGMNGHIQILRTA